MDNNLVKVAAERIAKARAELILTRTFYGVLVGQVTPVPRSDIPTMATNGRQHFFNPTFVTGLRRNWRGQECSPQALLLGVQAHESEHDARRHHTRRGIRDPKKWNEATDFSINIDLVDQGFELPEGALIDPKFRGMSAEDIYRTREIDEALANQPKPEDEPEEGEDEGEDAPEQSDSDPGETETGDADGEGDESETEGDEGDGGNGQEGDEGNDEGETGGGEGDPTEDGEADGEGSGEGEGEAEGDGPGESSGGGDGEAQSPANVQGEGEGGEGQPIQSSGDPGGCGEVLDAATDAAEIANEDAKWERVLRQAAALAAKRGTAPGHVSREIEHADHPPQDWRETLRAYFDGGATTVETWSRPNRRLIGSGIYMPGRERDGLNRVVFMIDTSGSVTYYPGALEAIKVETQAALDENIIDELVILYGDTQVTRVDTYRGGDEIEFDPRGGGGTVMRPMFEHVAREVDDASLIVAFTDLEIEPEDMLGPEPACPVLWAVVGYPESVKRYLAKTPWNAPGIEVRPDV